MTLTKSELDQLKLHNTKGVESSEEISTTAQKPITPRIQETPRNQDTHRDSDSDNTDSEPDYGDDDEFDDNYSGEDDDDSPPPYSLENPSLKRSHSAVCSMCEETFPADRLNPSTDGTKKYCQNCYPLSSIKKRHKINRVNTTG